jgi:hypothetical protein
MAPQATTLKQSLEADFRSLVAETRQGGALASLATGLLGGATATAETHGELKEAAERAILKLRSLPEDVRGGGRELLRPFLIGATATNKGAHKVRCPGKTWANQS